MFTVQYFTTQYIGFPIFFYFFPFQAWTEIGRMDPHRPQMFYPTTNTGLKIRPGDELAARCTMVKSDLCFDSISNSQFPFLYDGTN